MDQADYHPLNHKPLSKDAEIVRLKSAWQASDGRLRAEVERLTALLHRMVCRWKLESVDEKDRALLAEARAALATDGKGE